MSQIESQNKRLLLISNSTLFGSGYLDHAPIEMEPGSDVSGMLTPESN